MTQPRLLDRVRAAIRTRHFSYRTEQAYVLWMRRLHESDLQAGFNGVSLPFALARKYPNAPRELAWQYVFPSRGYAKDPRTGILFRHHAHPDTLQRAIKKVAG
jgi:hypothetical protein